jgi:hypothetical protein
MAKCGPYRAKSGQVFEQKVESTFCSTQNAKKWRPLFGLRTEAKKWNSSCVRLSFVRRSLQRGRTRPDENGDDSLTFMEGIARLNELVWSLDNGRILFV